MEWRQQGWDKGWARQAAFPGHRGARGQRKGSKPILRHALTVGKGVQFRILALGARQTCPSTGDKHCACSHLCLSMGGWGSFNFFWHFILFKCIFLRCLFIYLFLSTLLLSLGMNNIPCNNWHNCRSSLWRTYAPSSVPEGGIIPHCWCWGKILSGKLKEHSVPGARKRQAKGHIQSASHCLETTALHQCIEGETKY